MLINFKLRYLDPTLYKKTRIKFSSGLPFTRESYQNFEFIVFDVNQRDEKLSKFLLKKSIGKTYGVSRLLPGCMRSFICRSTISLVQELEFWLAEKTGFRGIFTRSSSSDILITAFEDSDRGELPASGVFIKVSRLFIAWTWISSVSSVFWIARFL